MLEVKEVFFIILVSLTAIIPKILFVNFNKCCRSLKLLFNEQAVTWNGDNDFFFFQEILEFEVGQYHSNYKLQHFQGQFYAQEKNY